MMTNFFTSAAPSAFNVLWNKYRPAIVQLMLAADQGPQQYKLYDHEFKALAAKEKTFSFVLHAFQGKAKNDIKKSLVAQDLLSSLNLSRKATEEMEKHSFEFKLDKHFVLHVARMQSIL